MNECHSDISEIYLLQRSLELESSLGKLNCIEIKKKKYLDFPLNRTKWTAHKHLVNVQFQGIVCEKPQIV